ncbi:hypothetical protein, partial [Fibrella forsythiae]
FFSSTVYYIRLFSPVNGRWAWRPYAYQLIRELTGLPGQGLLSLTESELALKHLRNLDPYALLEIKQIDHREPEDDFIYTWSPVPRYD